MLSDSEIAELRAAIDKANRRQMTGHTVFVTCVDGPLAGQRMRLLAPAFTPARLFDGATRNEVARSSRTTRIRAKRGGVLTGTTGRGNGRAVGRKRDDPPRQDRGHGSCSGKKLAGSPAINADDRCEVYD